MAKQGLWSSLILLLWLLAAVIVQADDSRPRVALVLSGGGALGYAHIGVLDVLEEMQVPVDCVVGASMGALVGGAWAAGVSPATIGAAVAATDIAALFDDDPPRTDITQHLKRDDYLPLFDMSFGLNHGQIQLPAGASAGYKIELFLRRLLGLPAARAGLDFDRLPTPYRAVATDLENGRSRVFADGDLARVMRASMSLPGVLTPVELDGRLYIDGGIASNLPVDVGRELCGDVVIAVNLGTRPKPREQLQDSVDVALQSVVLLTEQNVGVSLQRLQGQDVLILPDLQGFDSSSFSDVEAIIKRGRAAALASAADLRQLAVDSRQWQAWQAARVARQLPDDPVSAIRVDTGSYVNADAVSRDVQVRAGASFDQRQLHKDITDIFGRGDFSYVAYQLEQGQGDALLVINAEPKPWGPGYLKFGLGAAADFSSPAQLNLAASYRRTWINRLGAEWRTDVQLGYHSFVNSEFIQPLQLRDGAFIAPGFAVRRHFVQFYQGSERLGDVEMRRQQLRLDLGVTGSKGELRFGPYISRIDSKPDFTLAGAVISDGTVEKSGLALQAVYDQLDRASFPRQGLFARLDMHSADGKGEDYTRAQLQLKAAGTFARHTLALQLEAGDEISSGRALPTYDAFKLGGPNRLSGLYLDQLTGSRMQLATVRYYRQYASLPAQLGTGMYVGFSVETGRMDDPWMATPWDWVSSASVFWGADTFLGPVYLGYGDSNIQQGTFYLMIGPRF